MSTLTQFSDCIRIHQSYVETRWSPPRRRLQFLPVRSTNSYLKIHPTTRTSAGRRHQRHPPFLPDEPAPYLAAFGLLLIHDALFFHSRSLTESLSRHCGATRSCRMVPIPAAQEPPIKSGEWAAHAKHDGGIMISERGVSERARTHIHKRASTDRKTRPCNERFCCRPVGGSAEACSGNNSASRVYFKGSTHSKSTICS